MKYLITLLLIISWGDLTALELANLKIEDKDPQIAGRVNNLVRYLQNGNVDRHEAVLQEAVKKYPHSKTINYLMGKYYEEKSFLRPPFMITYYLKYYYLNEKYPECAYCDDVIMMISEYYIVTGIQKETSIIGNVNDDTGAFKSINVSELMSKVNNKKTNHYKLLECMKNIMDGEYEKGVMKLSSLSIEDLSMIHSKWIYNSIGYTLIKKEEYYKAEKPLKIATMLDPGNLYAHVNLGYVYYKQNRFAEALDQYKKALAINPSYTKVTTSLEECERQINRKK